MFLIREVLNCKPGKVNDMVKRFKAVSKVMERMNVKPFRVFTDVSGERFWALVAETEAPSLSGFMETEAKVMADRGAQAAMSGYHDLVEGGRREIYKLEA